MLIKQLKTKLLKQQQSMVPFLFYIWKSKEQETLNCDTPG